MIAQNKAMHAADIKLKLFAHAHTWCGIGSALYMLVHPFKKLTTVMEPLTGQKTSASKSTFLHMSAAMDLNFNSVFIIC